MFDDLAADMTAICFEDLGQTASYVRKSGGEPIALNVVLDHYPNDTASGDGTEPRPRLRLPVAVIGTAVRGDVCTVGGKSFRLEKFLSQDDHLIEFLAVRL